MTPELGREIRYRKKGKDEWHIATVTCIWQYDNEIICDLSDSQHLIESLGDEWYDA